jgi:ribosomal-protein-alanine N-acetyltransferase
MENLKSHTNGVFLRELVVEDRDQLAQLANNKKIFNNIRDFFPHPYTKKNAEEFIAQCNREDPKTTFAIEFSGEFSGVIGLVLQQDIYRMSAEIGYWIGEPFWNKGIASEAVKLMIHYGFKTLGLVRIHTGVFDYNKASQRVLEKCGFIKEGVFRNSVLKNGVICDEYRYAVLNNRLSGKKRNSDKK